MFGFVPLASVKENLNSRSFRPFLYLKDTAEVGLISLLNNYFVEIQISTNNFIYTSMNPKFTCILVFKV